MTRLAIVEGSGFIDEYTHAVTRSKDVHISAVVEADPGAAEPLTSLAGLKWSVTSWSRLFSNHADEFDAVVIHQRLANQVDEISEAAHELGKHVLACISPVRCYDVLNRINARTSGKRSVVTMVSQPLRFMHYQRAAWESLSSGKIGRLGLVRMHHWMSKAILDHSDDAVSEMIVREADLACWLFDSIPEVVYGIVASRNHPLHGILFHLGFGNGGMAIVDCNHNLIGHEDYNALSLIGSDGAVYADDQHNTNLLLLDRTFGQRVRMENDWFSYQLAAFRDAISRPSETPTCSVSDALRAVDVTNAVVNSFRAGQATTITGANDELR